MQAGFDPDGDTTLDAFLGGRLRIMQPRIGYRAATDPVLLAAACPAIAGEQVLDVGAGVGTAAFCLGARVPGLRLIGVEAQPDYAALSERNAALNQAPDWTAHVGDIAAPSKAIKALTVDHVITNPPFFAEQEVAALPIAAKDRAHREAAALAEWVDFCLRRLRPRGRLTMIHRSERLPELLAALTGRAGSITLHPLWPRPGAAAKRFLLSAVKEGKGPLRLTAGTVLHGPSGDHFTDAAEAILRGGAALPI